MAMADPARAESVRGGRTTSGPEDDADAMARGNEATGVSGVQVFGQKRCSTLQAWVEELPLMQQSVLLAAVRGADGVPKFHKSKMLVRFLRRSFLISAFDGKALNDPWQQGGGSFTGPSIEWFPVLAIDDDWCVPMKKVSDDFVDSRDEMSLHYYAHFMHAAEILGYKHPDIKVRYFWLEIYSRLVNAMHMHVETMEEMDLRLGDNEKNWRARSDESSTCSE